MAVRDQLISLAAHNAYHLGRIVVLRQLHQAWPRSQVASLGKTESQAFSDFGVLYRAGTERDRAQSVLVLGRSLLDVVDDQDKVGPLGFF